MTSELIAILEKEANEECERILAEARAQADRILAEATQETEAYLDAQRKTLEAERRAVRIRAESAARVRAAALVLQAKDRSIAEVFERAQAELDRVPQNPSRYAAVLRGLIEEGASALEGRLTVEVHPDDVELARAAVRELGLDADVRAADDVRGGARLATAGRRLVVENTLTSRLARVKSAVATEVAGLLWGP